MEISAIRELENKRTEIKYLRNPLFRNPVERHLSIPTDKKDEFVSEFSKKYKKNSLSSLIGIFAGALVGDYLGGKAFKNKYLSFASSIVGALAFALASKSLINPRLAKDYKQFFEKYDAQKINPDTEISKK